MRLSYAVVSIALVCLLPTLSPAANILLVTDSSMDADTELRSLLTTTLGHTIDSDSGAFTGGAPTALQLQDVDLIIVSRATNSGNYDEGTEPSDWNSLDVPLVLMNTYIARSTATSSGRWGWVNSTSTDGGQPAPTDYNAYLAPTHPFVNGLTTSVFPSGHTIDGIAGTTVPSGATLIATITTGGTPYTTVGLADYPVGTTLFTAADGSQTTLTARRVIFNVTEYPDSGGFNFGLSSNGEQILSNVIDQVAIPEPSTILLVSMGLAGLGFRRKRP